MAEKNAQGSLGPYGLAQCLCVLAALLLASRVEAAEWSSTELHLQVGRLDVPSFAGGDARNPTASFWSASCGTARIRPRPAPANEQRQADQMNERTRAVRSFAHIVLLVWLDTDARQKSNCGSGGAAP
ncbi:MAG: hypothetical protein F4171_04945 [Gammaproteobacteria bacterium]|nr:hypothetical protein [Gammaproteobacteria bacterium]MYF11545.1 hypothetical protein [Gammaproteobacteria bacterium]MYG12125.1 hypothetical protein [Gammaproteobacteria bacterium]MYK27401.1 hypothetical protein [Gammaproteobacteria bacterium]